VAFHCWIVRQRAAGLEIVLQRRARAKDTFPGCWDASAAGHWRAGETAEDAAREIAEELGVAIPFASLVYAGQERSARRHPNGLVDREIHRVHVARWDRPLLEYHPDPAEVSGVASILAADLLALVAGQRASAPAREAVAVAADGAVRPEATEIRAGEVVPYSRARIARLVRSARRVVAADQGGPGDHGTTPSRAG
jgi:isopentenyldiphosphate isomerase